MNIGLGITLGMVFGVVFGLALDNIGLGISLGVAVGLVFGMTVGRDESPKPTDGGPGRFGGRRPLSRWRRP